MRLSRRGFLALGGQVAALSMGALLTRSASSAPLSQPLSPEEETLDYKIGQMLMMGFRGSVLTPDNPVVADIRDRHIGGVVLFDSQGAGSSNITSAAQLKRLTADLQAIAPTPLLISVDQEGGSVARLKPQYGFAQTVSQQYLGNLNDASTTYRYADETAGTLRSTGINMNLAPVVDLNTNPSNPVIGVYGRSFSADPLTVTTHSEQVINAHREHGIFCTLKHFPGHGSSRADSHLGFTDVTATWSPVELEPYMDIIRAGLCDVVMTAHIFNANLDPDLPATLSRKTITGLLRDDFGFDGVVMTDDMQMRAITDNYSFETALRLAILAGVDIITIGNNMLYGPGTTALAISTIKQLVANDLIPIERIDQSYQRIKLLKSWIP
ncbi:MAG: glycoside hydrolase family 3 N-terminal domain-containing protein [Chloroflexota bacterium]